MCLCDPRPDNIKLCKSYNAGMCCWERQHSFSSTTPSIPTNSKSDKVRLFLFENDVKKAVRKYVMENYNLDISDIDFHKASDNIFVECTVEED